MIPRRAPMDGTAQSFIFEAKVLIIRNEPFFAGQDYPFASLLFSSSRQGTDELAAITMTAVLRQCIQAEDHLPFAPFIVKLSLGIHVIGQIFLICDKTIDEADDFPFIVKKKPKMIAIISQAFLEFRLCCRFCRRKTSRFDGVYLV